MLLTLFISSPLDQFEIKLFMGIMSPFYNITNINITTITLYTFIVLIIIVSINLLLTNNNKIIGSRWYLVQEIIYDTMQNIVKGQINGKYWGMYFPFIYTLFVFILISNLISLIPYSFALTAQIIFIISLSIIIWLGATIIGFTNHGIKFFSLFVPNGTPLPLVPLLIMIELLSYIARALSLGLRLLCNILAGHLLIIILAGLLLSFMTINLFTIIIGILPFFIILAVLFLEFAIAIIQAYVWSILTCSYLKDTLYLH